MPRPVMRALPLAALPLAIATDTAFAADLPDGLVVDLRYRSAHIDEDGYARAANANTLRATLGYLWNFAPSFYAYAEGTRVISVFGDDYNSGANGRTKLPSEGDPSSSEFSSAWVGYASDSVKARVGRQYVNLDDQRFFTSGLWRQNPQSFDALSAQWSAGAGTTLRYVRLDEAHRSVGNNYPDPTQRQWSLDANLFHVDQTLPLGKLTGYDYFVENRTMAKFSWRTAGLRWTGDHAIGAGTASWTAEFAEQRSWRNNPLHYSADYHLLEFAYGVPLASLKVGDELLGGNGHAAFSSPYGSNHGFNGWTSQFKNVPANGLEDRYLTAFGKISPRLSWSVTEHDFYAQRTSQRYGSELNALVKFSLRRDLDAELDYADYHRHSFGTSERELWVAVEYHVGATGGG